MDDKPEDYGPVAFKGWKDARTLVRYVRTHGLTEAARTARKAALLRWEFWAGRRFDKRFDVDTTGLAEVSDLTPINAGAESGGDYMATSVTVLRGALSKLPRDLGDFTFIDYGSGKGRALLIAAEFSFRRVVGVEFTQELHDTARGNIRRYRNPEQKCANIESVCADAATFEIPPGPCVFYYYNCFQARVFSRMFANVAESWRQNPRKMYFIFYHLNPACASFFEDLGIARKARLSGFSWRLALPRPYVLTIYETI